MKHTNRLCIYMTYNKENKIYPYIEKVLKSLKVCCSRVYLVCNCKVLKAGLNDSQSYVDNIFFRENIGYDSGAFKDALCEFLGWDEVYRYDELVLVNDSFFGFFYPLQDIFELMDKQECDYWGMTGQTEGEYKNPFYEFDAPIQSYFLVIKKKVLMSQAFREFWEKLQYSENFSQAVIDFEVGLNEQLKQKGFIGKSFIELYGIQLKRNENPCYSQLYKLVKDCQFPIMKKKCVLIRNVGFEETLKTIVYLEKEKRYPTEWVKQYLENQFYIPEYESSCFNSLELFYRNYSTVYIYGAGVCGKNIAAYFDYKGWNFKGFISTEPEKEEVCSSCIEKVTIDSDTGIIVSVLNAEIAEEIAKHIGTRCSQNQLFFISACSAIKLPK